MKKFYTRMALLLMFVISGEMVKAQVFEQGTKVRDLGFQLQKEYRPISFNFERGVADDIGIGGRITAAYNTGTKNIQSVLQVTGSYHFSRVLNLPMDNLDLHAGVGFGTLLFYNSRWEQFIAPFLFTPSVGARYYFSDGFGVFGRFSADLWKDNSLQKAYGLDSSLGSGSIGTPIKTPSLTVGVSFKL